MTYEVYYTPTVRADIAKQIDYFLEQRVSEAVIERWIISLFDTIDQLYELPHRYPIDPGFSLDTGRDTHKLVFGNYLVFFEIDDARSLVRVVGFTHGARRHHS